MEKNLECDCNIIHEDAVKTANEKMITEDMFDEIINFYKVIGDSTRCRILFVIDQHEMCVCDIANVLGMTKSAISHQLKILKDNYLVKSRREGKEVFYTLDDDHVKEIFETTIDHIEHKREDFKNG